MCHFIEFLTSGDLDFWTFDSTALMQPKMFALFILHTVSVSLLTDFHKFICWTLNNEVFL